MIRSGSLLRALPFLAALVLAACSGNPPTTEEPPPIIAPEAELPETSVGAAYEAALQGSGGTGTLRHRADGLPPGIELAGDGTLSGAATAAGTFTVSLHIDDDAGAHASRDYPLVVLAAPAFQTAATLPGATVGFDYVTPLVIEGGKAPYLVSVAGGELPPGIGLEAGAATLAGAPQAEGTFSFTLQVQDAHLATATRAFTLVVAPELAITTDALANGNLGLTYLTTLAAAGGRAPLSWERVSGTLPVGLSLDAVQGRISGTPQQAGPFTVVLGVRDANGALATKSFTAQIHATPPPAIATASLPNGVVGQSYSHTLSGQDGAPPYAWMVTSGQLPAGVTLSQNGVLSGVPTEQGPFPVQVTLTDANAQSAARALTLTTFPELVVDTQTLPESYTGQAYSQTLAASGGQPPYVWSVAGGALPAGISLSSSGILSGAATQAGSFGVTIQVADASGQTPARAFTVVIFEPPTVATSLLADAVVGTNYSQTLQVAGGKAPFTWAVTQGALPAGIQLLGNVLAGTPTAGGTSTFVLEVTDATGRKDTRTLAITVYQSLAITTGQLPDPYVGTLYSEVLAAAGGATPYTWALTTGSLPQGVALAGNGTLSGVPTAAGTVTFTVEVTAQNGATAQKTFALVVRTQPSISTTSLADGYLTEPLSRTIAGAGGRTPYTFSVAPGTLPAGLTLSTGGVLSGVPTAAGTSSFTVTLTDANGVEATAALTLAIFGLPAVSTSAVPDGYVGAAYSQTLAATGGKAPLQWTVQSGVLPAGVTLGQAGALGGAPTAAGSATFTVQVADDNGRTATRQLTLATYQPPQVATTSLPGGTLATAYAASLAASGGKAPLGWIVSSGTLPAGLTLGTGGAISGTPGAAGTTSFSVTVTDANGQVASANLSITVFASLTVGTASPLPDAYAQVAYSLSFAAAGGQAPYGWALTQGQLPSGMTLSPSGALTGTASAAGNASFTVTVTDNAAQTASKAFALTVVAAPTIPANPLPDGYVGLGYAGQVAVQNGRPPYGFAVTSGALPAGLTLGATSGEVSGAPTATGSSTFQITATDANGLTAARTFTVGVFDAPQVDTPSLLPDAYAGTAYALALSGSGGKTPYMWSVVSGALPSGMTLSATGALSGAPTATGSVSFSAQLADANGQTATRSFSLFVRAPLSIATPALPDGYVGAAYPGATVTATGGKAPHSFAVTAGAPPAGLTLASGGLFSGNPGSPNPGATFTVTVTDANNVTATRSYTVAVFAPPAVTTSQLADGYVGAAYSSTLAASGGKTPFAWTLSGGALPAGINLSGAGALSGTPGQTGTFNFQVTATDQNGVAASGSLQLVVLPALVLTTSSLADGYVGTAYAATLAAAGGKTPYTFSISSGGLPAGVTLTGATLSGTPSASGTATFTAQVQDANGQTASAALSIAVFAAPSITTTTLADGYAGTAYSAQLQSSGGKGPFTFAVTQGALPGGVTLSVSGALAGTPAAAGNASFTVTLTDANGVTATRALTLTVNAPLVVATATLADAYVSTPYSATLSASGGKTPYGWALAAGSALPPGLSLAPAGGLSGTSNSAQTATFTVVVTDANGVTASRALDLAVLALPQVTTTALADGYPGVTYSQQLAASGGRTPHTFTATGALPAGVSLAPSGLFSGAPTAPGSFPLTVTVTDANNVQGTKSLSITVLQSLAVTTAALADGYVGVAYAQPLAATGGKTPYAWSIASGTLPAGLSLAPASGALSGSPTAEATASFTVRVTDDNGQTQDRALSIATFAPPTVTTASPLPDGYQGGAYALTLARAGGKPPFNWTVSAGALPAGLNLAQATGELSGTPSATGATSFTVRVTDDNGQFGQKAMQLTVLSGFFITTNAVPDGYVGSAYSTTLAASGGLQPYGWAISGGSLPAGVTLSPTGTLSGTPSAAGSASFTVVATDGNSATTSRALTLEVLVPPSVTTAALPDGYVGEAYNLALAGTGGKPPYTWQVAPALPAGLTLSQGGALTGAPTGAGTGSHTFTLTDANGRTAAATLALARFAPPAISVPPPADAYVGVAYALAPALTGGKAPFAWTASPSKPAWIALAPATGALSGTPPAAGPVSFGIDVTDANGRAGSATVAFTVYALPAITTASLPGGFVGVAYEAPLQATGGKAPLGWSVSSGTLPPGLSLTVAAGQQFLAGTPSQAGSFPFTLAVTDPNGQTATRPLSVQVTAALAISTATLPDAYRGATYSTTVTATGGKPPYTFDLASGTLPQGLALSSAGAITGTPDLMATTQSVVVRVTDDNGSTQTRSFDLAVFALPVITTTALPDGYLTESYAQAPVLTGGKAPFTWTVSAGALPAGVSLNPGTGQLSGTPTTAGNAGFTLSVLDANGRSHDRPLAIGVFALPAVSTASLPDGYGGQGYVQTLAASGGKAPLQWQITGGALPPGLTLSMAGSVGAMINPAGVTNGQSFAFTAQVEDANGRAGTRSLAVTVYLNPTLATAPLTVGTVGVTYMKAPGTPEALQAVNGKAPHTFTAASLPTGLSLSLAGVFSGTPTQPTTSGASFTFTVTDANGANSQSTLPLSVVSPTPILTGGTRSVAPGGSPITDRVTVFAIGPDNLARPGVGVRVRRNGVEYTPQKEGLTGADGKVILTGLGLNGTTDTVDITANGAQVSNYTLAGVNAALVTLPLLDFPLPGKRSQAAGAIGTGNQLVVFGGQLDNTGSPSMLASGCPNHLARLTNATSATWTEPVAPGMTGSPPSRWGAAMGVPLNGNTAVMVGGVLCESGLVVNDTLRLDLTTHSWFSLAPAPFSARSAAAIAPDNQNRLMLIGGLSSGGGALNDAYRFDPTTNTWNNVTSFPNALSAAAGAYNPQSGQTWFCGGKFGTGQVTGSCFSFNPNSFPVPSWVNQQTMPGLREGHAMATATSLSTVFAFGGRDQNGTLRNELFALTGSSWSTISSATPPPPRAGHVLAWDAAGGRLLLYGGQGLTGRLDDLWTFDPASATWTRRSPAPPAAPATFRIAGSITSGAPAPSGQTSYAEISVTTRSGLRLSTSVGLGSTGSGSYEVTGIPAGETVTLVAVNRTTAPPPNDLFRLVDLGELGPIGANTTQNLSFAGGQQLVQQGTGTIIRPADWAATLTVVPALSRASYPMLGAFNGASSINSSSNFTARWLAAGAGTSQDLIAVGTDTAAVSCEQSLAAGFGVAAPSVGTLALPVGIRGRSPGVTECSNIGSGFSATSSPAGGGPVKVAVADFDNDGRRDLIVSNRNSNQVNLLRNLGGGNFTMQASIPVSGFPEGVATADFDQDGKMDFAVARPNISTVDVYRGDGAAGFQLYATFGMPQARSVATGDVNGDGRPDLVVAGGGAGNGQLASYLATSSGFFPPTSINVPVELRSVAVADMNGDGLGDAVVACLGDGRIRIFPGTVTGISNVASHVLETGTGPGGGLRDLAVADFDGDGRLDVAATLNGGGGSVQVFTQPSPGTFQLADDEPVNGAFDLVAAQLTGGAALDLAVTSSGAPQQVRLLAGSGNGTFAAQGLAYFGTSAGLAAADLDGDAMADLAVTEGTSGNQVTILIQQTPMPTLPDQPLAFTAPADTALMMVRRGAFPQTVDWIWMGRGAAGAQSVSFPLPSTLAPSRAAPSGQPVVWAPATWQPVAGQSIELDELTLGLLRYSGHTQSGGVRYVRQ